MTIKTYEELVEMVSSEVYFNYADVKEAETVFNGLIEMDIIVTDTIEEIVDQLDRRY